MRFLFATLQYVESDFYGRVGTELERRGHEIAHVTYSRQAAHRLRHQGSEARCLPDEIEESAVLPADVELEAARIEREYELPSLRSIYRTDVACLGKDDQWCVERTVGHFVALERIFDEIQPEVLVPEVGNETIRTAAHLIALRRGIPTLFLFYTIFPDPLRLYVDTMQAQIVTPDEQRPLTEEQRAQVEEFIDSFISRDRPIRAYHHPSFAFGRSRIFIRHLLVRALRDRDNDYLRPWRWLGEQLVERARARVVTPLYEEASRRPFVYFPLHRVDDYKIQRLVPHLTDQAAVVHQVARALPQGYDLVIKEHPMSLGRNPISLLRELRSEPNVRLVGPTTSSHELIRDARGVAVIGSTVGLEALLHFRPVLTIGKPFYSGAGVTLDVDSLGELQVAVPALLDFQPDRERVLRFLYAAMSRCRPGAPVLVDRTDANAVRLAETLAGAADELARGSAGAAGPSPVADRS
jgi:hypothetical protein